MVKIDADKLNNLPKVMAGEILLRGMEKIAGRRKDLTSAHVAAVMELAQNQSGKKIDLPYEITGYKEYNKIISFIKLSFVPASLDSTVWSSPLIASSSASLVSAPTRSSS